MSADRLKVLHVTWSGSFGGIEKFTFDFCTSQLSSSISIPELLICKKTDDYFDKFKEAAFKIYNAQLNSGFDISVKKYIYIFMLFKNYNILHFHSFNPLVALMATLSGKKIIYTEHGTFGKGRSLSSSEKFAHRLKGIFINRFVDFISFNSADTRQRAEEIYNIKFVPRKNIFNGTVISNGGVNKNLSLELRKKYDGYFIIGTTSRFVTFKRIELLIEAFAIFSAGKKTLLLLVGDGTEMNNYKKLVSQSGIESKVVFAGYQKEISSYQNVMDVCVFPSRHEPFGLVAIEALVLEKPVIVFEDGGGLVEIIKPFDPSNVVNDTAGLVTRLEYYYQNRIESPEKIAARKKHAQTFDINNVRKQFDEIYLSFFKIL